MQPSIYERIDGVSPAEGAVDVFYEKVWVSEHVWADPALAAYFEGIDRARLKAYQRAFMATPVGGYERHNGWGMGKVYAGLGSIDAVFDQVVAHLATTLSQLGLDEGTIGEIASVLVPLRADIVAAAEKGSPESVGVVSGGSGGGR